MDYTLKSIKTSNEEEVVDAAGEPLSPGARMFLEPSMNCCIVTVLGSKKPIDVDVVKEGLKDTVLQHPRFSSKVVVEAKKFGRRKKKTWVRTQVNLDEHVIVPDLDPAEVEKYSPDRFLQDYLLKLTSTPLDLTRPLWEIHLLKIKTSDALGIGVLKIHHSLGDGISIISFVLACTRKTSDPNALPSLPTKRNHKNTSTTTSSTGRSNSISSRGGLYYIYRLWTLLLQLLFLFRLLWNTAADLLVFLASVLFYEDTHTPIKGPLGTENKPRLILYKTISFEDIKLVKNEMNVTVNDVMMGLVQAALSRYLNRKYANNIGAAQADKIDYLPKNLRVRACLLVNVRPTAGIQAYANMMAKGSKCPWGNKMGYIILPFHISLRDDPLEYIRQAKAAVDRKKQSLEAKFTYWTALLILKLFGEKVVADMSRRLVRHTTMCFSNVVGPVDEISFYGHPMGYFAATAYGHPQALTIHFQSHADKITITVSVDETVLSDSSQLLDDLTESLQQIKNILIARRDLAC